MSKPFSYPEFENGIKVLSTAGDAENDMMRVPVLLPKRNLSDLLIMQV